LREAEKLFIQKIHPLIIIEGWREAKNVALETLKKISRKSTSDEK